MSLKELVQATAQQLAVAQVALGQGTLCVWDEAAWLVLAALQLPLDTDLEGDTPSDYLTPARLERVQSWVHQRTQARIPTAYLSREAWLQGLAFYVDERCIIPRSWIAQVLADGTIHDLLPHPPRHIVDLCTGNGSLAILTALAFEEASSSALSPPPIWAIDLCPKALEVAHINVARYKLEDRVTLIQSDGWAQADANTNGVPAQVDLIVCNPPYVTATNMARLPPEFQAEPRLALDGNTAQGQDGMDWLRQWLRPSLARLSPQGMLVLEVGREKAHFERAFPDLEGLWLPIGDIGDIDGIEEPVVILWATNTALKDS
jgi:ribosomal protein L3 glutamine methyltransferase